MPIFHGGCGSSLTSTLAACMSAFLGEITVSISLTSQTVGHLWTTCIYGCGWLSQNK